MPQTMKAGDVVVGRYRLIDRLNEARGAHFWLGWDNILARHIALHLIPEDDPRAAELGEAARRSAAIHDPRMLRVLDLGTVDGMAYVVNEWGEGRSLNHLVVDEPLSPRRAAWMIGEVAEFMAKAHAQDIAHGRLVPENVMIDEAGAVKVIGFCVDAVLHGLPAGRVHTEVLDLAGLLYTALTGRWAGPSKSTVAPAPIEHGRTLRPRQVRAGVPRVLDALCDEVLSPYSGPHDRGYDSAAAIAAALMDYVGDPAAMAEAEAALNRGNTSPRLPKIDAVVWAPDPTPAPDPEPEPEPEPEPDAAPDPGPDSGPEKVTELTVAGTPVFFDEMEDVGWLDKHSHPEPPPPPPFEEPVAKPLFAPDPPEGTPMRTRRPGHDTPAEGGSYWPWETGVEMPPPTFHVEEDEDDSVPGRNWMRSAWIIIVALLVVFVMLYAFNRGRGGEEEPAGPAARDSASPSASESSGGEPYELAAITDLDPYGDPPEENGDLAELAIDGDNSTAWQTQSYRQQFGPGGLKPGVGLVIDLGEEKSVGAINVRVNGDPTGISAYVVPGDQAPSEVEGLEPAASGTSSGGRVSLEPEDGASGRWVIVWITDLPDGLRGQIAEIQVSE